MGMAAIAKNQTGNTNRNTSKKNKVKKKGTERRDAIFESFSSQETLAAGLIMLEKGVGGVGVG